MQWKWHGEQPAIVINTQHTFLKPGVFPFPDPEYLTIANKCRSEPPTTSEEYQYAANNAATI